MKVKLIKEAGKLRTLIVSIETQGKKLDVDIHRAACSCLSHAEQHGDVTLATALVDAMPKSGRRKALIHWFVTNGKLAFKKGDVFSLDKGKSKSWKLEEACETPFWDLIPEPDIKTLTIEGLVAMVKNKIAKAQENEKVDDGFSVEAFELALKVELAELAA